MAIYTPTITTTPVQEKGLAWRLARENESRAALIPPGTPIANVAAMLDFLITRDVILQLGIAYKDAVRRIVADATETASGSQLANAATALGVTLP